MRLTGHFLALVAVFLLVMGSVAQARGPRKASRTYQGWPVTPYPEGIGPNSFGGRPRSTIYRVVIFPGGLEKGLRDPRYLPKDLPDKQGWIGRIPKRLPHGLGEVGNIKQHLPDGVGPAGRIPKRLPHGLGEVGNIKQHLPDGVGPIGRIPKTMSR